MALTLLANTPSKGCLTLASTGKTVSISGEEALIVWDAAHQREDFVRRADFQTNAKDFGFLVPVPSTPRLTEVDQTVFDIVHKYIAPETRGMALSKAAAVPSANAVDVVSRQEVAGYDTSVLAASDSAKLEQWLRENHYQVPGGFQDWVKPYVDAGWKLVAFKMTKPDDGVAVSSKLVRISFQTDRPYYPYREPRESTQPLPTGRQLRVYVLSSTPVDAIFGTANTRWVGYRLSPHSNINRNYLEQTATRLSMKRSDLPSTPTLSTFFDNSSPRIGTNDVWFQPSDVKVSGQ